MQNRRNFLKFAAGLTVAGALRSDRSSTWAQAPASSDWTGRRRKLAERRRRIIYNDDGDARYASYYGALPNNAKEFLARRFDWTVNTQVDSFFWCIGDGREPPWGKQLPDGFDCTTVMMDAARKAGQEAVISLRMNDTHDAFGTVSDPFKLQNRHMLVDPDGAPGKFPQTDVRYWIWSALDYAHPEVRQHRLAYISKVCEKYVPDGFELDFFRHPAYFKPGQEEKNLPLMTEFVRHVRRRLNDIGQKHGRPILLIARVADTPEKSLKMGLDAPTWIAEGLLDVLIIGGGYAPFWTDWTAYRDLSHKHGVPAYPCFNCSLLHAFDKVEPLRGAASNWWHLGADGIYLFNPFVPVDLKKIPAETMYEELKRVGDPRTLAKLDKLYCQDYIHDNSPSMKRMTADPPLPAAIGGSPTKIPLLVGEEISSQPERKDQRWNLRLATEPPALPITVELNGTALGRGQLADDQWWEFPLEAPPLARGDNELAVSTSQNSGRLSRVHLWLQYRG